MDNGREWVEERRNSPFPAPFPLISTRFWPTRGKQFCFPESPDASEDEVEETLGLGEKRN